MKLLTTLFLLLFLIPAALAEDADASAPLTGIEAFAQEPAMSGARYPPMASISLPCNAVPRTAKR